MVGTMRTFAAITVVVVTGAVLTAAPAQAGPSGQIRVDQVGYATGEAKHAYLMAPAAATGARFAVVDSRGATVLSGRIGTLTGAWNDRFAAVHDLDFSRLTRPGTYKITVSGGVQATSPTFRIGSGSSLFQPLVSATNEFFQAQRDGADIVPGRLGRKPSHLVDRRATVYDQPVFTGDGGDVPAEPLHSTGKIVDVEGGWADAGDYLKFTANTSYSLTEMITAYQLTGDRALDAEIRHGLRWLDKVWDERDRVLYAQVGLGTGSEEFNFLGDHDVWRLPEADDARDTAPGDPEFFVKYRPVFPANPGGGPLSPNLAGRVAAAFALGAQLEASRNPRLARDYLDEAASVFAQAKTADVGELITAFPHAYYPESSWEDDMEFGATELALAGRRLGDGRAGSWARQATHWAKAYIASDTGESLNLYDTSGLAHFDLIKLLRAGAVPGAALGTSALIGDLRRQLTEGVDAASESPFGTAVDVTNFDAATRSFGFAAVARLYERATGDRQFAAFGVQQRNFALGANAWGLSLVVGVGTTYPRCPHHQTANLAGNGRDRLLYGAVINGPNGADNFEGLELPEDAVDCTFSLERFDGHGSRLMDDVRSWPSSEPAIDFVSTGMLAFALAADR
jgi:endoglucanase